MKYVATGELWTAKMAAPDQERPGVVAMPKSPMQWVICLLVTAIILIAIAGCAEFKIKAVQKGAEAADTLAVEAVTDYYLAKAKLCFQVGQSAAYRTMSEEDADGLHAWCKERGLLMRDMDGFQNDVLPGQVFLPDGVRPTSASTDAVN